jgi:hypothetical protein
MKYKNPENQVGVSSQITVQEAGARGGRATLEKHGPEFLRRIAKLGGESTARRYRELMSEFGRRGGRPRRPVLSENMGEGLPQKKEGEMRSAPGSSSPAKIITQK